MNAKHLAILSPLSGIAAGVLTAVMLTPSTSDADKAPPRAAPSAEDARVAELLDRVAQLEKRGPERVSPSQHRTAVGMSREEIAAVVKELLAESTLAAPRNATPAEASGVAAELDLTDTSAVLAKMRELGVNSNEARDIWKRAKEEGRLQELVDAFQAWADENPGDPDVQCDLARAYSSAAMQDPNHPEGLWWRNSDGAYSAALEADPQHWDARFEKAVALTFWPAMFGRQPEAIRHFETLIEQSQTLQPSDEHAEVYVYLGNLHLQNGDSERAQQIWNQGLGRYPTSESLRGKVTGGN